MRRLFRLSLGFIAIVFVLPVLAHAAIWASLDRPQSWREADWSSSELFTVPEADSAAIYIMNARTGGMKGAVSSHSWIVLKKPGTRRFDRYDVVGWGRPVRKNAYAADARWYSNQPRVHHAIHGEEARALIPLIEQAIAAYPWREYGDYTIWPGPNSNTFVASIIDAVPGLDGPLPPTAVGRDFPADGNWVHNSAEEGLRLSAAGYAGVALGGGRGFEVNFLGLVAGVDPSRGALKLPGFGTLSLWDAAPQEPR